MTPTPQLQANRVSLFFRETPPEIVMGVARKKGVYNLGSPKQQHCDHERICFDDVEACAPCDNDECGFDTRSHPAPSTDCITCPKPAVGYGIGKDEARLTQCNTCMFDGKRECMYHGYPDETIPSSCEYKIGKYAVVAPIEAQLHNQQRDAIIAAQARNKTLTELIDLYDKGNLPEITHCNTTDEWYDYGWSDCTDKFVEYLKSLRGAP